MKVARGGFCRHLENVGSKAPPPRRPGRRCHSMPRGVTCGVAFRRPTVTTDSANDVRRCVAIPAAMARTRLEELSDAERRGRHYANFRPGTAA